MKVLMDGIAFGESPRWHEGRIWFSDWGAHQVIAVRPGGGHEVVATVESFPLCFDFLPDGRLLAADSARQRLLRQEADGAVVTHADLSSLSARPWNEVVVDAGGGAYVNNIGFDFPAGPPGPGFVAYVTPEGDARVVADDLAFPNGMAITADGGTLIVAESHASRLTAFDIGPGGGLHSPREWAATDGDHPDGICIDTEGAAWYADVANRHCVRVREGGQVLQTVTVDRGAFSCALSRGADPKLYIVGQEYGGPPDPEPTGQLIEVPAPAPGGGRP